MVILKPIYLMTFEEINITEGSFYLTKPRVTYWEKIPHPSLHYLFSVIHEDLRTIDC